MRSLLLGLLLLATTANAQTLTRSNYFDIGDSALYYLKFDTAVWSIDPGAAGQNVVWDFSNVDFGHPSVMVDTLLFIDPVGTPFYPTSMNADYSNANICMLRRTEDFSPENNDYNYYHVNDDSLAFLGHWAATGGTELWEDQLPDPRRDLLFPLAYGNSYTDTFTRIFMDMSGSGYHSIAGLHTVTVDGSGTLITPDGDVLGDVLRLHEVTEFVDSSMFGQENYILEWYRWYSEGRKGFVIALDMYPGETMVNVAHYQRQTNLATSITGSQRVQDGLEVFPNPAEDGTWVQWKGAGVIRSVEIMDNVGRSLRRLPVNSDRVWMERGTLRSGIYTIRASIGEQVIMGRILFR